MRIVNAGNGGALNNNNANNNYGVRPIERIVRFEYARKAEPLSQGATFPTPLERKGQRREHLMMVSLSALISVMDHEYFDKAISYGSMRRALNKCCLDVRWKDSVVGYELYAPRNTYTLIQSIRDGTYKISPYQTFIIYEPKKREIVATRIRDRQFQMSLCMNGLYDDITEHFIYDNCACQIGKGTDFALGRVKAHMQKFYREHGKEGWVMKLDVHHFFPETRHDVAKAAIGKRVSDPRARQAVFDVIDSFDGDKGIGLGSQISQLVELAVLDDLDHFIKEKLRIKHYVRYMDDMIFIHEDRDYLKKCWDIIKEKLRGISLELNKKSCLYPLRQGVKFLHWRFVLTDTGKINQKMDASRIGKERRRLKALLAKEARGEIEEGASERSLQAWEAGAARGDSYYRRKRMSEFYERTKGEIYGNFRGTTPEG